MSNNLSVVRFTDEDWKRLEETGPRQDELSSELFFALLFRLKEAEEHISNMSTHREVDECVACKNSCARWLKASGR